MTDSAFRPLLLVAQEGSAENTGLAQRFGAMWSLQPPGSAAIINAAVAAAARECTHVVPLPPSTSAALEDACARLQPLLEAAAQHPHAVIIGHSNARPPLIRRMTRVWRRFWFRIQTGRQLTDSHSDWVVYPVPALLHLPLWRWKYTLHNDLLVKAAWAGISIHAVVLEGLGHVSNRRESRLQSIYRETQLALLNFVLTLRAMFPWPHARVPGLSAPVEAISLRHPITSLRHLQRRNISPRQLAAAGALGVLLGTLPLFALHTVTILFSAGYLRLNRMVALSASQLCMPPLVPAFCISLGYYLRHGSVLTELSIQTLGYQAHERLWEWLLGSLLLAPLLAIGTGALIYGSARLVFSGNAVNGA